MVRTSIFVFIYCCSRDSFVLIIYVFKKIIKVVRFQLKTFSMFNVFFLKRGVTAFLSFILVLVIFLAVLLCLCICLFCASKIKQKVIFDSLYSFYINFDKNYEMRLLKNLVKYFKTLFLDWDNYLVNTFEDSDKIFYFPNMLTILSEFDEDSCLEVPVSIKTIMHTLFFFFKLSVILPIKLDYLLNILIPICHESSFLQNKSLALFSAIFLYFLSVFLILICFCFIVCVSKTKTNYLLNLPNLQLFVLSLLIFAFVAILNNKLLLVLGGWNFLVVLLNLSKNLRLNVYEQSKNKFLKPKRTQRIINKNFIQNVFLLTAMNLVLMSSTLLIFVELIQHDLNLILLFVLFIIFMFIFAIFIETVALLAAWFVYMVF